MTRYEYDYVATGVVRRGEWMLRYLADAEGAEYHEISPEEAREITRQLEEEAS